MRSKRVHTNIGSCLLISGLIDLILIYGCSSEPKHVDKVPEYVDQINISVTLGPSRDLGNLDRDDLFYKVTNKGDRTVTELFGELVFHEESGTEVGRTGFMFVSADPHMERLAVKGKKARWRPLPPGQTINDSYEAAYILAGESELRDKIRQNWDNLTVSPVIKKVVAE